jgi:transposase
MEVSMSNKRYTEEFKIEAVKQVTERGHSVADVAARLGVSVASLHGWIKRYSQSPQERQAQSSQQEEMRRLKAELRRVTEERDILKKAAAYFAKQSG